jgi:hypothetical protein
MFILRRQTPILGISLWPRGRFSPGTGRYELREAPRHAPGYLTCHTTQWPNSCRHVIDLPVS